MEETIKEHTRILLTEDQVKEMLCFMQQKVKSNEYKILWARDKNMRLKGYI